MRRADRKTAALPRMLSVRAVSEATTIPATTIYDAVYDGELSAHRFGRAVRIAEDDVRAWIAGKKEG